MDSNYQKAIDLRQIHVKFLHHKNRISPLKPKLRQDWSQAVSLRPFHRSVILLSHQHLPVEPLACNKSASIQLKYLSKLRCPISGEHFKEISLCPVYCRTLYNQIKTVWGYWSLMLTPVSTRLGGCGFDSRLENGLVAKKWLRWERIMNLNIKLNYFKLLI